MLVERDVEALGGIMLDLSRAHIDRKLLAWVPKEQAGVEAVADNPLLIPPAKGLVAVPFLFDSLDDEVSLTIDSHSSSPAFAAEAKALVFDLVKTGGMDIATAVEHLDAPDPDELIAGITRRQIAAAEAKQEEARAELLKHTTK